MKNILILLLVVLVASCAKDQNKDNKVKGNNTVNNTSVNIDPNDPNVNTVQPPAEQVGQVNILPDENGVVFHYVCEDLCEGGASNEHGNCPACGKQMAHNQGFHAQEQNNAAPVINQGDLPPGLQDLTGNGGPQVVPSTPPSPEPPQNSNGVWHYTCSNGCAGGAGSASACSSCVSTLVHNAAYHNS